MNGAGPIGPAPSKPAMGYRYESFVLPYYPHVLSLRTLLSLGDLELDDLPFLEVAESLAGDAGIMNKHVLAFLRGNESVALLPVEPLHRTLRHTLFLPPLGQAAHVKSSPYYYGVEPESCLPRPPPPGPPGGLPGVPARGVLVATGAGSSSPGCEPGSPGSQVSQPAGRRSLATSSAIASPTSGASVTAWAPSSTRPTTSGRPAGRSRTPAIARITRASLTDGTVATALRASCSISSGDTPGPAPVSPASDSMTTSPVSCCHARASTCRNRGGCFPVTSTSRRIRRRGSTTPSWRPTSATPCPEASTRRRTCVSPRAVRTRKPPPRGSTTKCRQ